MNNIEHWAPGKPLSVALYHRQADSKFALTPGRFTIRATIALRREPWVKVFMIQKINLEFNNTDKHSSAGRMEKCKKRVRGSNWNHAHTMALAELKREASLNKEYGPLVWERIAQTLSSRFPRQDKTGAQSRRRWDTLVKVYNYIEDYCVVTGQDHRELDEGELASMELATAYHQDWYDIVEQVCSQRKRKEICDRDLMLAKRSKGSYSVDFSESLPNRDTLCPASTSKSVTHYDQSTPESTTTYAQGSPCQSLVADKLSPEEEFPRFENGNDGLVLEETQLRPHRQVYHEVSREHLTLESANLRANQHPQTFLDERLKEPSQDDLWNLVDAMPFETWTDSEVQIFLILFWIFAMGLRRICDIIQEACICIWVLIQQRVERSSDTSTISYPSGSPIDVISVLEGGEYSEVMLILEQLRRCTGDISWRILESGGTIGQQERILGPLISSISLL